MVIWTGFSPSRFRLGSLSAQSARVIILGLVLFGVFGLALIAILVYAVPCTAAFKKTPAAFWRTFTVLSLLVAAVATFFCTYGFKNEIECVASVGFPFAQPVSENSIWSAPFILNGLFASGLCLLPLGLLSTLDTVRKAKAPSSDRPLGAVFKITRC